MKTKYRLKSKKCLPDGVRRIATEQLDRAIYQLIDSKEPRDEAVHDTRKVRLVEYEIQMPTTLTAGPTTFKIMNKGQTDHNIAIENGAKREMDAVLKPGETGTLKIDLIDLKPGEYYVWCPVGSHEAYGMSLDLTVTE